MNHNAAIDALRPHVPDVLLEAKLVEKLLSWTGDDGRAVYNTRSLARLINRSHNWVSERRRISKLPEKFYQPFKSGIISVKDAAKIGDLASQGDEVLSFDEALELGFPGVWVRFDQKPTSDMLVEGAEVLPWSDFIGSIVPDEKKPYIHSPRDGVVQWCTFRLALTSALQTEYRVCFKRSLMRKYHL